MIMCQVHIARRSSDKPEAREQKKRGVEKKKKENKSREIVSIFILQILERLHPSTAPICTVFLRSSALPGLL